MAQAAVLTDVAFAALSAGAPAIPDPDPLYKGRTGENAGSVGSLATSRETVPSVIRNRSSSLSPAATSSLPEHSFALYACPDSTIHLTRGIKGDDDTQVGSGLVLRPPPAEPIHSSPEGGCGSRVDGEEAQAVEGQSSDMTC